MGPRFAAATPAGIRPRFRPHRPLASRYDDGCVPLGVRRVRAQPRLGKIPASHHRGLAAGRSRPSLGLSLLPAALLPATLLLAPSTALAQGRAGSETEEDVMFKKAEEQFNAGDYVGAADLYDQVIKINPNRVEAFVKRATLHFRERDYTKAIELLTRAEKLSVSDLTIKTVLGLCFTKAASVSGAFRTSNVVKQRAETYEAQFQIGKHYARPDPTRAIAALEQYFRYRPMISVASTAWRSFTWARRTTCVVRTAMRRGCCSRPG